MTEIHPPSAIKSASLFLPQLLSAQDSLSEAWRTRSKTDINIAVTKWKSVTPQIPCSHKEYEPALSSYSVALLLRWNSQHYEDDLELAIQTLEKVLVIGSPTRARFDNLVNIGAAYMDRWERFHRNPEDLLTSAGFWDEARSIAINEERLFKEAVLHVLPNLGDAYCYAHSRKLIGIQAIDWAISYFQTAIQHVDTSLYKRLHYKLGKAFSVLHSVQQIPENFAAACFHFQEAINGNIRPDEAEDAVIELRDLYITAYKSRISHSALQNAISWARRVVDIDQDTSRALRVLGGLLALFYKDFNHYPSLNEAIHCYDQVWSNISPSSFEDIDVFYHNFGVTLLRRFLATESSGQRRMEDINRAVQMLRLAVDRDNGQDLSSYSANLKLAEQYHSQEIERLSKLKKYNINASKDEKSPFLLTPSFRQPDDEKWPRETAHTSSNKLGVGKERSITRHEANTNFLSPSIKSEPSQSSTLPPLNELHRSTTPKVYPEVQVWRSHYIQQPVAPLSDQLNAAFPKTQAWLSRMNINTHPANGATNTSGGPPRAVEEPILVVPETSIRPSNLTGRVTRSSDQSIAEGGFASIFIGKFEQTKVAIKVIKKVHQQNSGKLQKRLHREMDVWWKLEHPNIVSLLGFADDFGPFPSMISPWYENGNAADYVQKAGLGIEFRLNLLKEVSTGLRYLHSQSPVIVHGDLKPGNVLIDNSGAAKICDFGLSHLVASGKGDTTTSLTGNVGTVRYSAPELRCPEDDNDCVEATTSSDIYSLACIAYEFLCQKQPFDGKNTIAAIIAAGYQRIPPARKNEQDSSLLGPTAPHFWDLFDMCWDEDHSKRPHIDQFYQQVDLAFEFYR